MAVSTKPSRKGYTFPMLVKNEENGCIIFATEKTRDGYDGVIVHKGDGPDPLGTYSFCWKESLFTPFRGRVVIETL